MLKNMWWLWLVLAGLLLWKNWDSVKKMLGMGGNAEASTAKPVDYSEGTDI